MKLPDIDDKYKDRNILILAGSELVAFKLTGEEEWSIKETSCNLCGECCMGLTEDNPHGIDDEGKCKALVRYGDTWECSVQLDKPYECLYDPQLGVYPSCSITYKKVKI